MTANPLTGVIAEESIKRLYSFGLGIKDWTQIKVAAGGGSGYRYLNYSGDTLVATQIGPQPASTLEPGGLILGVTSDRSFGEEQMNLIRGTCLGDGSLRMVSRSKATLRIGHGVQQKDYMQWKHKSLSPYVSTITKAGNGLGFDSYASATLAELRQHLYDSDNNRVITHEYASQLTLPSIAAWFMDDGNLAGSYINHGNGKSTIYCFAIKEMSHRLILADTLEKLCGARPTLCKRGFIFSGDRNRVFQESIAPYVLKSMNYKIVPKFRKPFAWEFPVSKSSKDGTLKVNPMEIVSIKPMAKNRMGRAFSFEIPSGNPALLDYILVYGGENQADLLSINLTTNP